MFQEKYKNWEEVSQEKGYKRYVIYNKERRIDFVIHEYKRSLFKYKYFLDVRIHDHHPGNILRFTTKRQVYKLIQEHLEISSKQVLPVC